MAFRPTILVPLSNGFPVRNLLRTAFLADMLHSSRLVLLAPREKMEFYRQEFSSADITFDVLPALHESRLEKLFRFIEQASIATEETRVMHWYHFVRQGSKTAFPIRVFQFLVRRSIWHLALWRGWQRIVRVIYRIVASDEYGVFLRKYKPDLVFCPTLIYGGEYALLLSARRRGIKTVGMIASWDNFYSKTLLRAFPNRLLVTTGLLKDQAINLYDYSRRRITVVGLPQYDRYFSSSPSMSRAEFVRSIGGDPAKKLIVYAFSGKIGVGVDMNMLSILHEIMKDDQLQSSAQVLVRPYPKLDFGYERVAKMRSKYGFLAAQSLRQFGEGKTAWEFDAVALDFQHNTLCHADVIISMYSTFFVEGAIFNKPLIAISFDGSLPHNRFNSVANFFRWEHLRGLEDVGGVRLVRNTAEFSSVLKEALSHPNIREVGRKRIVEIQCVFSDGGSARRVASAVIKEITRELATGIIEENWRSKKASRTVIAGVAMALIRKHLPKPASVLDVGSGSGDFIMHMAGSGHEFHSADRKNFLSPAAQKLVTTSTEVDLNTPWPFADGSFDAVSAWHVVEHLENPFHFFREAKRVLRPGGFLFIAMPNVFNLRNRLSFLLDGEMYRYRQDLSHVSVLTKTTLGLATQGFALLERGFTDIAPPFARFNKSKLVKRLLPQNELFGKSLYLVFRKPIGMQPAI